MKKQQILVIALLALVSLMIIPASALEYNENIQSSGTAVRTGVREIGSNTLWLYGAENGATYDYPTKWYSADNPSLPALSQIYYKTYDGQNLSTMPDSVTETLNWYVLSDALKTHSLATAQMTTTYETGNYRTLSVYFTKRFELSELTGTTQEFNVTWSGNKTWYNLAMGRYTTSTATINASRNPFTYSYTSGGNTVVMNPLDTGSEGYLFSDYDYTIDWDLKVNGTLGLLPISVSLTPSVNTNAISYYAYNGGTLGRSSINLLGSENFSHGWNPIRIYINSTTAPGFSFDKTYDFSAAVPTPTPLPQESPYILTLSPGAIAIGGNVTATLSSATDPTLALISGIQYSYYDEGAWLSTDFFEPTTPTLTKQYGLFGGVWKQFNTTVLYFSDTHSGIPNPDILQFSGTPGTKTVQCFVYLTTGQYYELTGTVIVGQGAGYIVTRIQAFDGLGGGLIYYPEIDIYNKNTGQWTNRTYASGAAEISTPINTYFNVYGIKAGYINAKLLNIIARDDITYQLPFFTGVTPSAGNQSLSFWVTNINGQAISGAQVILKESGTTSVFVGTTSAGGIYNPIVKQSTLYTYTVTKSGYVPGSGSLTTSAESSDVWVHQLKVGVVVTATIPPREDTDTKKATDAFSKWMNVLGDITDIAIGVVIIWLMWITVYMITGGKIIDKIMKRGRR